MLNRFISIFFFSFLIISCEQEHDLPEPGDDIPIHDRMVAVIHPTDGNEATGIVTFTREGERMSGLLQQSPDLILRVYMVFMSMNMEIALMMLHCQQEGILTLMECLMVAQRIQIAM